MSDGDWCSSSRPCESVENSPPSKRVRLDVSPVTHKYTVGTIVGVSSVAGCLDDVDLVCVSMDGTRVAVLSVSNLPRFYLISVADMDAMAASGVECTWFESPRPCVDARSVSRASECEICVPHPYVDVPPGATLRVDVDVVLRARVCLRIGYDSRCVVTDCELGVCPSRVPYTRVCVRAPLTRRFEVPVYPSSSCVHPSAAQQLSRLSVLGGLSPSVVHMVARLADIPVCLVPPSVFRMRDDDLRDRASFLASMILSIALESRVATFVPDLVSDVEGGYSSPPESSTLVVSSPTYSIDVSSMYPSIIVRDNVCVARVGVLPRVVSMLISIRSDLREPVVHRECAKLLANTMYGLCASRHVSLFRWVNRGAMAAVTLGGRLAIQFAMSNARSLGGTVLGGMTDSLFVTGLSESVVLRLCADLNVSTSLVFRVDGVYSSFLMVHKQAWIAIPLSSPGTLVHRGVPAASLVAAGVPGQDVLSLPANVNVRALLLLLRGDLVGAELEAVGGASPQVLALVRRPYVIGVQPLVPLALSGDYL